MRGSRTPAPALARHHMGTAILTCSHCLSPPPLSPPTPRPRDGRAGPGPMPAPNSARALRLCVVRLNYARGQPRRPSRRRLLLGFSRPTRPRKVPTLRPHTPPPHALMAPTPSPPIAPTSELNSHLAWLAPRPCERCVARLLLALPFSRAALALLALLFSLVLTCARVSLTSPCQARRQSPKIHRASFVVLARRIQCECARARAFRLGASTGSSSRRQQDQAGAERVKGVDCTPS